MKRFLPLVLALLLPPAWASDECKVELRNDLRVSSKSLEVSSGGKTHYVIRQEGRLRLAEEEVDLSAGQRELAERYAGEVGALASQWVVFVSEALGALSASLHSAFGSAFGEDSPAAVRSTAAVARAKEKFEAMSVAEDGSFTLTAREFNDLGEVLQEEIEEAIKASLGTLFVELGETISSDEGTFNQRMEAFGQRMEIMGSELEQLGVTLESAGAGLCAQLIALQELEEEVARKIPELEDYPLFRR